MPRVAILGKQQPLKVRQMIKEYLEENISTEESDCRKMGLHWDKQNGLCEAK